jgi:methyl-accepting chemotaxis protein
MAYKRRQFLINRRFQLRFSFYVCSWIFGLSLIYPLVMFGLIDNFLRYAAIDPLGPPLEQLQAARQEVIAILALIQAAFIGITFLISIFVSHRIAGPIFKLQKYMRESAMGQRAGRLIFRKSDHFQELAEDYNRFVASQDDRARAAIVHIEKALGSVPEPSKRELEQALSTLRS